MTEVRVKLGPYQQGSFKSVSADDFAECGTCGAQFDEPALAALAPSVNAT
jgi:hypothetical protein